MLQRIVLFIGLLLSSVLFSSVSAASAKMPMPLAAAFSYHDYQLCQRHLRYCYLRRLNRHCEKEWFSYPSCFQLTQLADKIDSAPDMLMVTPFCKFSMVTVHYLADGQEHYYIITPKGGIIDTVVDPRQLDKTLKTKFPNTDMMLVNEGKLTHTQAANGTVRFVTRLRITKSCLACKLIGHADIAFKFNKQGTLLKTTLVNFQGYVKPDHKRDAIIDEYYSQPKD